MTREFLPPLALAAVIVAAGAVAIAMVPATPPPSLVAGRQAGRQDSVSEAIPGIRVATRSATMQAVERPSPIVGADGTLEESLGIENAGDRFLALIPKGTRAPISAMLRITPSPARPTEIRFHLLRGTSGSPAGNHSLGHFRVTNLPAGAPTKPRAIIIFRVSGRAGGGAVQVAAVNPDTGEPLPLDRVPPEPHH